MITHYQTRAVDLLRQNIADKLKGKTMSNLPDDITGPTDVEVEAFVRNLVPMATDVDVSDHDDDGVLVEVWLNYGDVER